MPLLGFFFGNRIGLIITAVVLLSGAFFSWLAIHNNEIWNKATDAFNNMQQELLQKKKEEFDQKTEVIKTNADKIREAIAAQEQEANKELDRMAKKAEEETKTTVKPVSDDAAPYLKSIVKQLNEKFGEKKK